MYFLNDPEFTRIVNNLAEHDQERKRLWRTHIYCWAFTQGCKLGYDLMELGVYRGFYSAVATRYVKFENYTNTLWLYDTWNGVPTDKQNKNYTLHEPYFDPNNYNVTVERFAQYRNVKIVIGSVPEILPNNSPDKISFLHLDMNSAKSEIGALEVLFDRLVPGGVCLFDDFGLGIFKENCESSTKWLAQRGYIPMELPTGQAIVIKR